jgi:hypothetical protein
LLGSAVSEQLEQLVRRGDQVPFRIRLLQCPQQEVPESSASHSGGEGGSMVV